MPVPTLRAASFSPWVNDSTGILGGQSGDAESRGEGRETGGGGGKVGGQQGWLTLVWGLRWRRGALNHLELYWIFPPFDVIIAPVIISHHCHCPRVSRLQAGERQKRQGGGLGGLWGKTQCIKRGWIKRGEHSVIWTERQRNGFRFRLQRSGVTKYLGMSVIKCERFACFFVSRRLEAAWNRTIDATGPVSTVSAGSKCVGSGQC